jgi:hypothetical protein
LHKKTAVQTPYCLCHAIQRTKQLVSGSKFLVTTENLQNLVTRKQTWYMWLHLPVYCHDNNIVLSGQSEIKENGVTQFVLNFQP